MRRTVRKMISFALVLALLVSVIPMKNVRNLEAAKKGNLPGRVRVSDGRENRKAGVGGQGSLYLKGEPVTIKDVPVIEEWNIYGLGKIEELDYIRLHTLEGEVYSVYCLDYGKKATTGTIITGETLDTLKEPGKSRLEACLSIGYHGGKDSLNTVEKAEYAATQAVVWNIMCDIFGTGKADIAANKLISCVEDADHAREYYQWLKEEIPKYLSHPIFSAEEGEIPAYELAWSKEKAGFEVVLEDAGGIGKESRYECPEGISVRVNGEGILVSSKEPLQGKERIKGSYQKEELKSCFIYWNGDESLQRFGVCEPKVSVENRKFYFDVYTQEGSLSLEKRDSETKLPSPQGGADGFEGTVYGLFDSTYQDGDTKESDSFIREIRLDKQGQAFVQKLAAGQYVVKEIKGPNGYLLDETAHRVAIPDQSFEEPMKVTLQLDEQVVRGDLEIAKYLEDEKYGGRKTPLQGIVFTITSQTTGKVYEIVTDEYGFADTSSLGNARGGLPYDTYMVEEKNPPEGCSAMEPFEIRIRKEGQKLSYIVENDRARAAIKIIKVDAETGKVIPATGIQFQILDEKQDPVQYERDGKIVSVFETDKTGSCLLPMELTPGIYYLEEIKPPKGYKLGEKLKFTVTAEHTKGEALVIEYANDPKKGRLKLEKTDKDSGRSLQGVEFEVTAAESIATLDGTIRVQKGDVVGILVTGKNGDAYLSELYPGKYNVKETKTLSDYVLTDKIYTVEITGDEEELKLSVENEKKKEKEGVFIPDTGDFETLNLLILSLILSCFTAMLCVRIAHRKQRRNQVNGFFD